MRSYAIGRHFEYRVRDHFKEKGYYVLRSPKSGGPADLVAIKEGEVLLIQCKIRGNLGKEEEEKLRALASSIGAEAVLAFRGKPPWYPIEVRYL